VAFPCIENSAGFQDEGRKDGHWPAGTIIVQNAIPGFLIIKF
jgi:hypothetical protein